MMNAILAELMEETTVRQRDKERERSGRDSNLGRQRNSWKKNEGSNVVELK